MKLMISDDGLLDFVREMFEQFATGLYDKRRIKEDNVELRAET